MLPAAQRAKIGWLRPPAEEAAAAPAPEPAQRAVVRLALFNGLLALVAAAGVVVVVHAATPLLAHPGRFPLLFFALSVAIGATRLPAYGSRVSLSPLPIVAAAYLYGANGAALVGLAGGAGFELGRTPQGRKSAFNLGLFALSGWAGGQAGNLVAAPHGAEPLPLLLFGLAAALAIYGTNVTLTCCALGASTGVSPLKVWRERFRWMLPQTLLLGAVGTGVAVAYQHAGVYELVAFALPVVAMHLAWRQYLAHTTRSVEDLRAKNADLIQLAARLQTARDAVVTTYRGTLEALVGALDARDNEVQGHSYRVSAYSQVLAEELGVERGSDEWDAIARGALLHDVGKIGIRDAVLRKPGALDEGEWVEMRQHSEIGFAILRDIGFLRPAAMMVQAHHERYDGTGYPRGVAGDAIPLGARIFAVADAFDAMTTDRPYRKAMPPEIAVAEIRRCSGTQFDPTVVQLFLELWPRLWDLRADAMHMVA